MKKKLFFENNKGNKLWGILSNPTSNKEKPIIILCHGLASDKDSRTYVGLERILNKRGISTFRFDFWGHGESDGDFKNITISEAVNDILNALKFLKKSGYTKIGLMGSSFGGMASILAASKTDDLFALALKSPVSDYLGKLVAQKSKQGIKTWKENGFIYFILQDGTKLRLDYSFFEDAGKFNGYRAAEKIKIPTLIVHGDKDKIVSLKQSKKTSSLIKDCKLEIIKGADHFYSRTEDFEKMLSLISEFIIINYL